MKTFICMTVAFVGVFWYGEVYLKPREIEHECPDCNSPRVQWIPVRTDRWVWVISCPNCGKLDQRDVHSPKCPDCGHAENVIPKQIYGNPSWFCTSCCNGWPVED